jgi:hypothetical protein
VAPATGRTPNRGRDWIESSARLIDLAGPLAGLCARAREGPLRAERVCLRAAAADTDGRARTAAARRGAISSSCGRTPRDVSRRCQLGITIASIGLGVVGESAFEELLIGELVPKSVAISRTSETALRPLRRCGCSTSHDAAGALVRRPWKPGAASVRDTAGTGGGPRAALRRRAARVAGGEPRAWADRDEDQELAERGLALPTAGRVT